MAIKLVQKQMFAFQRIKAAKMDHFFSVYKTKLG